MYLKTHLEQLRCTVKAIRALVPAPVLERLAWLRERTRSEAPLGHPSTGNSPAPAPASSTPTGAMPLPQALPQPPTDSAPPPQPVGAPREPGVVLGTDLTTGREVRIPPQAHTGWIIGTSGTGKTTLLANLILSDIHRGLGVGLIEPHGDLTQTVLAGIPEERLKDTVYLDLEDWQNPFGLNLFACPERSIRTQAAVASFVSHAFEKIWSVGTDTPRLMQNLRAITRTLIDNPGTTMTEAPLLYAYEPVRRRMLERVTNPQIHLFWEQYGLKNLRDRELYTESTLNKINAFLDEPMIRHILGQERTTIPLREIMDTGKILLIKLSPQFEEASSLIGSVLIGQILLTAFSRADMPEQERRPFHLYCDEFQRFATSDFQAIINESRKFSIKPFLSHQSVGQLDSASRAALAAAGVLVVFRISGEDAKHLAKNFDTTPTKKVVIGTEPVRAPVADIVGHIVRRGHVNNAVSAFSSQFLIPFETFLEQVRHYPHPFEFGCAVGCRTGHLLEARRLLNDTLFASMQSGRPDVPIHPFALLALTGVANDGSSRVLHPHLKRTFLSGAEFLGFEESASALGEAALLQNDQLLAWLIKTYPRSRWWDSVTQYRYVYPGEAFIRLLRLTRSAMSILAAEPVLVDTGQYRDKYQLQTYADVENEIGNVLSSGLANFEAKVKLVTSEYIIRTRPAPVVLTGQPLTQRIEAIRRHMREAGYTRPYTEVAAEIQARSAFYRGLAAVPPPHEAGNGAVRDRSPGNGASGQATASTPQPPPPPPGSAFSSGRGD